MPFLRDITGGTHLINGMNWCSVSDPRQKVVLFWWVAQWPQPIFHCIYLTKLGGHGMSYPTVVVNSLKMPYPLQYWHLGKIQFPSRLSPIRLPPQWSYEGIRPKYLHFLIKVNPLQLLTEINSFCKLTRAMCRNPPLDAGWFEIPILSPPSKG